MAKSSVKRNFDLKKLARKVPTLMSELLNARGGAIHDDIQNGIDLQKDIDGTDRDTSGTAKWDIGADQCATCSKGNVKEASSKLPLNGDFGSFNIT